MVAEVVCFFIICIIKPKYRCLGTTLGEGADGKEVAGFLR
jgi:hypothetical protein